MNERITPAELEFDLTQAPTRVDAWAKRTVNRLLGAITWGQIQLVDGREILYLGTDGGEDQPAVTMEVLHARFYSAVVFGGSVGLAEAYMAGLWTCSDLTALVRILVRNLPVLERAEYGPGWISRPLRQLFHLFHRNTKLGSRKNILAHYDLGNDFYALFLDPTMTYSCGIFASDASSLEEASLAKYDRICRKLQLTAQDHVIEIGTGWGGFAVYAAQTFGCEVTTTTISDSQYAYAQERVRQADLDQRIHLLKQDYRDLSGQFDKLVSIEMIEAVGHAFQPTFFDTCARLLKPDGMMALQAITIEDQRYKQHVRDVDFIKRYIFPGSCLTAISHIGRVITRATDLRLVHLEDITGHYALTLRCWRERFFDQIEAVKGMGFSERFIRMWEYYLCYCEGSFQERYIGDVQMILCKPLCRQATTLGDLS